MVKRVKGKKVKRKDVKERSKEVKSQCNVKEGRNVTEQYSNVPYLTLILRYKLRKSYSDPNDLFGASMLTEYDMI